MDTKNKFFSFEDSKTEIIENEYELAIDSEIDKLKENIASIEKLKQKKTCLV